MIITEFQNRKSSLGTRTETTWEEFVDRLKFADITSETLAEYKGMTNEQRTEAKDVGGYVAGEFRNNRRAKVNLISRYVLAVDADSATDHDIEDYEAMYDYKFFAHTTHTSTPEQPRFRWLFPLSRPVNSSEYRQLMAEAKLWVGADTIDESTDQAERLMFWPSVCVDVDYQWWEGGTELLNPDDFVTEEEESVEEDTFTSLITTDGLIPEGQRNASVFSFAANLRSQGLDKDLIRNGIEMYNNAYCVPPLPNSELDTITNSVCKYPKGEKIPFDARDIKIDFSDLGKLRNKDEDEFAQYIIEDARDIVKEVIPKRRFLVDGVISTGLGCLIAPPKFGKSWLCYDLCISLATGRDFLGLKTEKCEVFYLALEDNKDRVQDRLIKVGDENIRMGAVPGIRICRTAPTMDKDRLLRWFTLFMKQYPYTKCIIIDTLQKIRGESKKNEGVYGYDYREMSDIQRFAINNDLSILTVHHTKKGIDDSDFLSNASGSNGIIGAMDYTMVLQRKRRESDSTVLKITGRDVLDQAYVIAFNKAEYRWENLGKEKDVSESDEDRAYSTDPLIKTIRYYLDLDEELAGEDEDKLEAVWTVSSQDLLDSIEQLYGKTQYKTTVGIGKRLHNIADELAEKDGITFDDTREYNGDKQVRSYSFKRGMLP